MKKKIVCCFVAAVGALLITASNGFSFSSFGTNVNTSCAPLEPYTGDCTLCHVSGDFAAATPAKDAYLAGGTTLTDYFCPAGPVCTDSDGDTFAVEGGDCGPIDCDDANADISPSAAEICTDNIDNNCNGLVDAQDPAAVGCTPACTDNDGDGFAVEGGECGPVDCDDTDGQINPNGVEVCTDGIDNNCNGLVDAQDPAAVDCPPACTDADGDTYAVEGGECGPVDCDDANPGINPGTAEVCEDGIDNNCNGETDEGCDPTCPDADGDTYQDAACGGTDCNDNDPAINPGAAEICGNGIDENCNGTVDDTCLTCPDGTLLVIKKAKYVAAADMLLVMGRATVGTTITVINGDTDQILAEGIEVKEGKWNANIKYVGGSIAKVRVMTSNGCTTEKDVRTIGDGQGKGNEKGGEGGKKKGEDRGKKGGAVSLELAGKKK